VAVVELLPCSTFDFSNTFHHHPLISIHDLLCLSHPLTSCFRITTDERYQSSHTVIPVTDLKLDDFHPNSAIHLKQINCKQYSALGYLQQLSSETCFCRQIHSSAPSTHGIDSNILAMDSFDQKEPVKLLALGKLSNLYSLADIVTNS